MTFVMENGVRVILTKHAMLRSVQRNIDIEQRLSKLQGKPFNQYRSMGVVAEWRKPQRIVNIITLW